MGVVVATEPYKRYYTAPLFSGATCFCCLMYAIVIVLPFLLCIMTNNFWILYSENVEKIRFDFRHEYFLQVMTDQENKISSNIPFFDRNFPSENQLDGFQIQSMPIDINDDGIVDRFSLDLSFIADQDLTTHATLLLFFNVTMLDNTNFVTTGMLQFDVGSQRGISNAQILSKVKFKQRIPVKRTVLQNSVNMENIFDANNYDIIDSLLSYYKRDYTIQPEYQTIIASGEGQNIVKLSTTIYLDGQYDVLFESTTLAMLKYAWIQYIVLFVPIWTFCRLIMRFAYSHGFFDVSIYNDLPKHEKAF